MKMIDQMGRTVTVPEYPTRIISLVPSLTELLFDLGLGESIAGVTKFCVHPAEQVRQIQKIGGTKQFRFADIDALAPDLIIGNKEENYQEGIDQLAALYPVWMSDIYTLDDALTAIRQIGILVDRVAESTALVQQIETAFQQLQPMSQPLRVGYFIWQKPYMVVGQQTFIHDMLARCGFINAFADVGDGRYPVISEDNIRAANLDAILLSSEPFPFAEKHRIQFQQQFSDTAIYLVSGEMFSWYGSRLVLAAEYFRTLVSSCQE
ncbi:MAG: helical backbone metal receptor [Chloroflexota bacterium]